jgi:hypothetical protein
MRNLPNLVVIIAIFAGCGESAVRTPAADQAGALAATAVAKILARTIDSKHVRYRPSAIPSAAGGLAAIHGWLLSGSGHGFSLELVTVAGDANGLTLQRFAFKDSLARPAKSTGTDYPESSGTVLLARARLPRGEAATLLGAWRSILAGTVERIEDPPEPVIANPDGTFTISGRSHFVSSSSDYVISVHLAGAAGPLADQRFCGYADTDSSLATFSSLSLREALALAVPATAWEEVTTVDDGQRATFSRVFLDHLPDLAAPHYWWWVRERALLLAARFGDRSLVPAILPMLAAPTAVAIPAAGSDASLRRSRFQAATALAGITGTDLRFGPDGAALPIDETAAAYRKLLAGR